MTSSSEKCPTCLLLATTRNWRELQWAPISFSMASLQMFFTTRVCSLVVAERTFRNLSGSILSREDLDSSRCSREDPFFLIHCSTLDTTTSIIFILQPKFPLTHPGLYSRSNSRESPSVSSRQARGEGRGGGGPTSRSRSPPPRRDSWPGGRWPCPPASWSARWRAAAPGRKVSACSGQWPGSAGQDCRI